MPVSRRACDHCRAHKLRCQWVEAFASCAQCRSRNKPCVMPSLPRDTNQIPESKREGIEATSRPISTEFKRPLTGLAPSQPDNISDRIKRLEEFVNELKSLPPMTTSSYQTEHSQSNDIGARAFPNATRKRKFDQVIILDKNQGQMISNTLHTQAAVLGSLQSPLKEPMARKTALPRWTWGAAEPSLPLKSCVKEKCWLPPPDEGYSLLSEYLHDFNNIIPLFHPEVIYAYVRDCYSGAADKSPLPWVLAYIALGIGHRLRAMSLFTDHEDTSNAEFYLNRCLAVLPDLLLQEPSLSLVQALLGVSVLLQTSPRSRRAPLFVSTAMHMAQDLGFNEAAPDRGELPPIDKQENYVFWIAFFMDTAMSLRAIRPNTQKLADISAPLPNLRSSNWWASNKSEHQTVQGKVNFFALHASLAFIQTEALDDLFSVRARQRSASLTASTFNSLISKLKIWRRTNSLFDKDASKMLQSMYRSDIVHSVILEASYFETLYQLHAANALGAFTHRLDVFSSSELLAAPMLISCDIYTDAQRLLEFAALIPQGDVSVTWATIYAQTAALCMVLSCYLHGNGVQNSMLNASGFAANTLLYKNTLVAVEFAASQANDSKLNSNIDVCRHLFAQVKTIS